MNGRRNLPLAGLALAAIAVLTACSGAKGAATIADDVARGSSRAVQISDDVVRQSDDLARAGRYPAVARAAVPTEAVVQQRMMTVLQAHLGDLSTDQAWKAIDLACQAKDWYDAGRAPSAWDAAEQLTLSYSGAPGLRQRVQALAEDLRNQSGYDLVGVLASFGICELAGA